MKINLKLQVINGTKDGRETYGPGLAVVPDGLAKQCLRDGIATEQTAEQAEAAAAAKAEAQRAAKIAAADERLAESGAESAASIAKSADK